MNVRVASSRRELQELHFSHGYRRTRSVASLLDDPSAALSDIVDANRAFEECVDRGVLVPWVTTAVCTGSPVGRPPHRSEELREVSGPEVAPCLGLDTRCTRGALNPASECCTMELLPRGTVCETDGSMLCDGEGACVDAAEVPEAERVASPENWLAVFPHGLRLTNGTTSLMPRVIATVIAPGAQPPGLPDGSLEIQAPLPAIEEAAEGIDADGAPIVPEPARPDVLAIVPPSLASASRATLLRVLHADLTAIAYDGPMVPHALVLPSSGATEVWVVRGALDQIGRVMSDGTSAGAVRLGCSPPAGERLAPAAAPTVRCELVDDLLVVIGTDVTLAWLPNENAPRDVLGMMLPPGAGGGAEPGIAGVATAGDFLPQFGGTTPCSGIRACTVPGGCSGERACVRGRYAACIPTGAGSVLDGCDGLDNNCNGVVDENAATSCNDLTDCTVDYCANAGTPGAECRAIAAPRSVCLGAVRPAPPGCVTARCVSPSGFGGATRPISFTNPLADPPVAPSTWGFTGTVPTGCSYYAANAWCTNAYDSCNCNGPELCNPTSAPGTVGCVSAPRFAPAPAVGAPPVQLDPCDFDGLACTDDRQCCETDGSYCRMDAILRMTEAGRALYDARQALCVAGPTGSWPAFPTPSLPGFLTPSPPLAARCTSVAITAPLSDVCPRDGNPCTVEGCSEALGGVCGLPPPTTLDPFPQFADGSAAGELILGPGGVGVTGPSCDGSVEGSLGCNPFRCNNTPTCAPAPRPAGTLTPGCSDGTSDSCLAAACDGAGLCNPYQRVDSSESCPTLPGCGPSVCSATDLDDSRDPFIPIGCRPPTGFCFYGGACVPDGTLTADGCGWCNTGLSRWAPSPVPGAPACADDGESCTSDVCAGGRCTHRNLANGADCLADDSDCTLDFCNIGQCVHVCEFSDPTCESDPVCGSF